MSERGRAAESPTAIPTRGWKDIGARVVAEIKDDHTVLAAAGVSFFAFLALIPGLAAAISVYSFFADPAQVQDQLSQLLGNFPEDARQLVTDQISRLAEEAGGAVTFGAIIGIALALWSASSGMSHLIEAVNVSYDEDDERSFPVKRGMALLFTLAAIVLLIAVATAVTVVGPWLETVTGLQGLWWLGTAITWFLSGLALLGALAVLYRVGPKRDDPEWEWVSVGSVTAVLLLLIASILFQVYVANFGTYNETYGSLAAVVILMFWLFIASFVILLGAQINSEIEHQTRRDTTTGPDEPMGERDAVVADTLGGTADELD